MQAESLAIRSSLGELLEFKRVCAAAINKWREGEEFTDFSFSFFLFVFGLKFDYYLYSHS